MVASKVIDALAHVRFANARRDGWLMPAHLECRPPGPENRMRP
jgi:hypothetical protein